MMFNEYGPLLTLAQLARILGRSVEGLRYTLRGNSIFSNGINSARIRLGRRIYFSTPKIAAIIEVE